MTTAIESSLLDECCDFGKRRLEIVGSNLYKATLRTRHGIAVDLWGVVAGQAKG